MTLLCVDGVDHGLATRALAPLALSYIDGAYANYADFLARGHYRLVVPITVSGSLKAIVADCEAGDLSVAEAATWAHDKLKLGHRPCVYGTQDTLAAVIDILRSRAIRADLCDYWVADWLEVGAVNLPTTRRERERRRWPVAVPTPYAAWQFSSTLHTNVGACDVSIVSDRFAVRHGYKS